ncbi:MAG: M15 family metallopeptidase [Christensenellales bacterium]|jgi:LAS superfamily LD-carboxypeptidase LdcB
MRTYKGARLLAFFLLLAMIMPQACAVQVDDPSLPQVLSYHGILCLVNRDRKVTKKYVPPDLVVPKVTLNKKGREDAIMLRAEAARALEALFEAALQEEHTLLAASGYRSFGIQDLLFQAKVKEVSTKQKAWRTVSPPGASEHQLGLAMDVQSPTVPRLNRAFGESPEGIWLAQNAHRFGFIIRYKQEWREITGYRYEPWHIRYIGISHASAIYELDIPYETYYSALLNIPEYILLQGTDVLLKNLVRDVLDGKEIPVTLRITAPENQVETLESATKAYLSTQETYVQAIARCFPAWLQIEDRDELAE